MQTQFRNQIPTAEHIAEAAQALDDALLARRAWRAAVADAEAKRVAFVAAQQRATQLSREAAEIEGAAA